MAISIESSSISRGRSHDTLTCHTDTIAEHLQSSRNYLNHHHRSCLRINCPKLISNDRLTTIVYLRSPPHLTDHSVWSPFLWALSFEGQESGQDQGRSIKGGDNGLKCVLRSSSSRAIESDLWNQVVVLVVVVSEIFNWKMPLGR